MYSKELKCFEKITTVCKNRGFSELANEIIKTLGPKYLQKEEIKSLNKELPKNIKYINKTTFLEKITYANNCAVCEKKLEKGDPAFLSGKQIYHVLCGLEKLGEKASNNLYYKKWSVKLSKKPILEKIVEFDEEEI